MAAFTLIFTPTTAVYGRSGYNKDGDDEEKDSGRSGYNKDGNDDDETQNKGRSGYNKDAPTTASLDPLPLHVTHNIQPPTW
ncbi:hypothetical protein LZ32DRAFT_653035 [Colletotrichum eremochloae]|nr:hypothetical protein LZ32DRAFT_653035 [Colletotrichum eremochloae]